MLTSLTPSLFSYDDDSSASALDDSSSDAVNSAVLSASAREYYGSLIGNFFYGPVLTIVLIWAKHGAMKGWLADAEAEGSLEQQSTLRQRLRQHRSLTMM